MKILQILNTKFFSKKGVLDKFSINRGVYCIWVGVTKQGGLVVKLKGFDRYWFCPNTWQVFSRVGVGEYRPLKAHGLGSDIYYRLYLNGQVEKVTCARILRENLRGIERFFDDESGEKIRRLHQVLPLAA